MPNPRRPNPSPDPPDAGPLVPLAQTSDALVASASVSGRGPDSLVESALPRAPSVLSGFRALRHRDFRLFFSGQLISLVGTWMQSIAQSWLVLTLTHSAFALGLVGALQFLPVMFLSPFGGTIADRFRKRYVLIATQTTMMLLAFILAGLVATGVVTFAEILVIAFLLGVANSIDMPTRQALVVELVGPEDLMNAIALNSTMFNSARLIGPAIGGLLIGAFGIAVCFFLNGASFIAVIVGLFLMRPITRPLRRFGSLTDVRNDLREGFHYVRSTPSILAVIFILGAVGTFGMNFNVVTPLMAASTLNVGATGLGWLTAAMGLGSLIASLGVAYLGRNPRPRVILIGAITFGIFEAALGPVTSFPLALVLLALIGGATVVFSAMANSYVQLAVPNQLRGRVMAIYMMVWAGTTPIGNALTGTIAESTGSVGPLVLGGVISFLAAIAVAGPLLRMDHRNDARGE